MTDKQISDAIAAVLNSGHTGGGTNNGGGTSDGNSGDGGEVGTPSNRKPIELNPSDAPAGSM